MTCARCSTPCAGSCGLGPLGACCPTTSRAGRPSTSRRSAGWRRAPARPSSTTCAPCCAWRPGGRRSPRPSSSTGARCNRRPRVARAGYDGHQHKRGSKVHMAVDTLGHLLALLVTPANAQERAQVAEWAQQVQAVTGEHVELAFVDQGYTGEDVADAAQQHGIRLEVVRLPEAKRGFVLLPRRWVAERSFAWAARFRRLAKDYERLPETLIGLHFVAFVCLLLHRAGPLLQVHNTL